MGAIAAGEKVVATTRGEMARLLERHFSDTLAVDMEGYGFLRALHAHAGRETLVVRGISDLLEGKGVTDSAGWQPTAAAHAAAFAIETLACFQDSPVRADAPGVPSGVSRFWEEALVIACARYPAGPTDRDVWERAGGDVSQLDLTGDGRTRWYRALRFLRQGGGHTISAKSLLREFASDYPNAEEISRVRRETPA